LNSSKENVSLCGLCSNIISKTKFIHVVTHISDNIITTCYVFLKFSFDRLLFLLNTFHIAQIS
jgi:hypothetical protein